jgi:hypothetical protein
MNVKIEMRDPDALVAAAERMGIKVGEKGTHKLYSSNSEVGIPIYLKDWRYPVIVKDDGTIAFDNFNGSWGKTEALDELKQIYGIEKAKIEARRQGYSFFEQKCDNGDLQLTITVEG